MDSIDLKMDAGDTKTFAITILDDNDDPVDLTDADITWVLMRHPGAAALVPKVMPDHITVPDPETGVFYVPLDPEDTADLLPGAYYYEAEVIEGDDTSSTVLKGRFIIEASSILPA